MFVFSLLVWSISGITIGGLFFNYFNGLMSVNSAVTVYFTIFAVYTSLVTAVTMIPDLYSSEKRVFKIIEMGTGMIVQSLAYYLFMQGNFDMTISTRLIICGMLTCLAFILMTIRDVLNTEF